MSVFDSRFAWMLSLACFAWSLIIFDLACLFQTSSLVSLISHQTHKHTLTVFFFFAINSLCGLEVHCAVGQWSISLSWRQYWNSFMCCSFCGLSKCCYMSVCVCEALSGCIFFCANTQASASFFLLSHSRFHCYQTWLLSHTPWQENTNTHTHTRAGTHTQTHSQQRESILPLHLFPVTLSPSTGTFCILAQCNFLLIRGLRDIQMTQSCPVFVVVVVFFKAFESSLKVKVW